MTGIAIRIDVVDDEESVRKALGRLLTAAGFDVRTFASGEEFLRSTRERRPDCIVLDVRMPHVDGFAVLDAMMQAALPPPVLMITGDDSADYRSRALSRGASAFLRKPVDDVVLLEAIGRALKRVGDGGG